MSQSKLVPLLALLLLVLTAAGCNGAAVQADAVHAQGVAYIDPPGNQIGGPTEEALLTLERVDVQGTHAEFIGEVSYGETALPFHIDSVFHQSGLGRPDDKVADAEDRTGNFRILHVGLRDNPSGELLVTIDRDVTHDTPLLSVYLMRMDTREMVFVDIPVTDPPLSGALLPIMDLDLDREHLALDHWYTLVDYFLREEYQDSQTIHDDDEDPAEDNVNGQNSGGANGGQAAAALNVGGGLFHGVVHGLRDGETASIGVTCYGPIVRHDAAPTFSQTLEVTAASAGVYRVEVNDSDTRTCSITGHAPGRSTAQISRTGLPAGGTWHHEVDLHLTHPDDREIPLCPTTESGPGPGPSGPPPIGHEPECASPPSHSSRLSPWMMGHITAPEGFEGTLRIYALETSTGCEPRPLCELGPWTENSSLKAAPEGVDLVVELPVSAGVWGYTTSKGTFGSGRYAVVLAAADHDVEPQAREVVLRQGISSPDAVGEPGVNFTVEGGE